jgi:hypothetical protein
MQAVSTASHATPETHADSKPFFSGILTGQAAVLIMAVVVMIVFTAFLGKGPLYPVQVIGSALLGEPALQGVNLGAVLAGLVLHQLGPSLLWGAIFGLLAAKLEIRTPLAALLLGLAIGVISMVGPYALIPFVMNALHGVDLWNREVPLFWDWAAHIVFGASFVLYPAIQRKVAA